MHVIATAGHVDHGKSTLVKCLTGSDPDRFKEEQVRGLTIDLGFASTKLESGDLLSIIDVPGHIRFLKNMLAGVGSVDLCLFVVAATEGWKPQSEEHLRILDLLGLKSGVIVLTKTDLADKDLIELAKLEIAEKVEGTFLEGASVIETDALRGTGIKELFLEISELLKNSAITQNYSRPRLWIDRSFSVKGAGTIVTGTLTGGCLKTNDELKLEPLSENVRIRGMQNHYFEQNELQPGSRCALNISGVSHTDIKRGDVLVKSNQWHLTTVIDSSLKILSGLGHSISRRGAYVAYIGSGEYPVRLRILGPEIIDQGGEGLARIFLPVGLPLLPGDRFILRESGRAETIGGGEILDVDPKEKASKAKPDRSVDRIIKERGWVDIEELGLLTGENREPDVGNWAVDPEVLHKTLKEIRQLVESSGPMGIELSSLDKYQRSSIPLIQELNIENGRLKRVNEVDHLKDHPFVKELENSLFAPPHPEAVDRSELRELVKRGIIFEEKGIFFAAASLKAAGLLSAHLLKVKPEGFTVSEFREAAGNTRKHAMPLLVRLDQTGVTRRRDNLRIAGPRLPEVEQ